ncbi:HypC/HybG/HupF family hydrogenase formation chaperone [Neptunomonas qingdaonensis]|uniref:Hydrogenase expression/formation protein HypC n=1 Tax=Neptunomonas qingdaonensis TaxID=1045558 RepID=A0A1I2T7H7_9GAMM|nr:HypC/HybG/HupF family hydrogenase formation chaperone [Neptunomonas qingdaonensis]SFG60009.1 hydrogenase expression/formation protein HypC [Neptunomonas qingdaonensis]
MCLAIPGKIEHILNAVPMERTGTVSFGDIRKEINLAFVPEADVGDYVIVHAGFAISKINPTEARKIFQLLANDETDPPC